MAAVDAYSHVFPVIGGSRSQDGRALLAKDVYGTAFYLGGGFWMTAGHVMKAAAENAIHAIGHPQDGGWGISASTDPEIIESHDVCIFRNSFARANALPWFLGELQMAADVFSVGYPYSLNLELATLAIRAFRGSVVAGLTTTHIPARPRAYELQYACPRGLSGAPVIAEGKALVNCGMIVGNASTETNVYTVSEVLIDGATTIVERYEAMNVGLAIQASALAALRFDLLGVPLQEHLSRHGLIITSV